MSAQLPRPSASEGACLSGRTVVHGKIGIATQRQRERAMLLARVDKSREPAAPATPSSVERAHHLIQSNAMKQVEVPLRARAMSPALELPATFPKLPPTIKVMELPATIPELPPTVDRVGGGEHVVGGG